MAEEFIERYRRGERPSITEYSARCPDLANEIQDLFPALVMMEKVRPVPEAGADGKLGANGQPRLERIGDFRILREIGRGGMGIVYEAEQESLGRHVALKVLPSQSLLDAQRLERFQREARAAARLHHTNIVPVFGVGEHEGLHYYVMQFISGLGLDQVVEELKHLQTNKTPSADNPQKTATWLAQSVLTGHFDTILPLPAAGECRGEGEPTPDAMETSNVNPVPSLVVAASAGDSSATMRVSAGALPQPTLSEPGHSYWQSIARIGLQVTQALHYAHEQGLLHRDIKPSNLLLDTRGTVWITDFGLAKAADSDDLTGTGDIVGTIRYMAPERFEGKSDPRSDLYSLGITLYELVTLQPAFSGQDRQHLFQQVLHDEPVLPRKIRADVPRDLETIILTAIAKDPRRRYATANAMAEDLQRFLSDRPIQARRSAVWERGWRWCRRNPLVASLLTIVALCLAGVAIVSTLAANSAKHSERQARLREADALVGQAYGVRNSHRAGQRFEALAALRKAAGIGRELGQPPEWFDRLRNEAIAALALADVHITHEFDGFPPGTVDVCLSDDFERYAQTSQQGACTVRRVADNSVVTHLPELGEPAHATFGGNDYLGIGGEDSSDFHLWDLKNREPARRFKEPNVHYWHFRPDRNLLALTHQDGAIRVYELSTGKRVYALTPLDITRRAAATLHPKEAFVAVGSYDHDLVQIRDLRTGAVVAKSVMPWPNCGIPTWSPDGGTLVMADGNSPTFKLFRFDPAAPSLKALRLIKGTDSGGHHVDFNPAGDRMIVRGWNCQVQLFDVANGQSLFLTHSLVAPSKRNDVKYDATGQRLAAARVGNREERIGLWSVADGREYRVLKLKDAWSRRDQPAVHPRFPLVAIGRHTGVSIFNYQLGVQVADVPILNAEECAAAFDGQGNLLTNSFGGLFRWPMRIDPDQPRQLVVGPPERLPFEAGNRHISASTDGCVIAQSMWNGYGMSKHAGGWILHPKDIKARTLFPIESTRTNSVSPDGRWVAFGLINKGFIQVYDTESGKMVWQSPGRSDEFCHFSRDGRWLCTATDGGRLYATGTWAPGIQLGAGRPWDTSSEGAMAVMGMSNGIYRLVEIATGRELARLEDPNQEFGPAAFTPDGTKLITAAKDGARIWDLRRIRKELTDLDLDWDAPSSYPPAADTLAIEYEIKIIPGPSVVELRKQAEMFVKTGRFQEGKTAYEKVLAMDPNLISANHDLAWLLATCPDVTIHDGATAVRLANVAVKTWEKITAFKVTQPHIYNGQYAVFLRTLGVAQYRAGQYKSAIDTLNRSNALQKDEAHDYFFRAMAMWKLDHKEEARDQFDQACKVMEKIMPKLAADSRSRLELPRFRAEAAELLGIESAK